MQCTCRKRRVLVHTWGVAAHLKKLSEISKFASFKPTSATNNESNVCDAYFILK